MSVAPLAISFLFLIFLYTHTHTHTHTILLYSDTILPVKSLKAIILLFVVVVFFNFVLAVQELNFVVQ